MPTALFLLIKEQKMIINEDLSGSVQNVVSQVIAHLSDPEHIIKAAQITQSQTKRAFPKIWNPISLAFGDAGIALLFGQVDRCFPNQGWDQVAHTYIVRAARAFEAASSARMSLGLSGGLAGLCFATYTLSRNGTRYQRLLDTLDRLLVEQIHESLQPPETLLEGVSFFDYDIIGGPAGIGAYLLLRQDVPGAASALHKILDRFLFLSEPQDNGRLRFFVPPERLPTERHRAQHPHGAIDCGLAHGVPGPLAFLALASLSGIEYPHLQESIWHLARWVIARQDTDAWGINWPTAVGPDENEPIPFLNRASWCYGSPGIARALWLAGRALQNTHLQDTAIQAIETVPLRPVEVQGLASPILCHGVAGLLQVTLRFAQDTRQPHFIEMASSQVQQLLGLFKAASLVGFQDVDPEGNLLDDPGLLEGASGVLLPLLATLTDTELTWDRLLLLS